MQCNIGGAGFGKKLKSILGPLVHCKKLTARYTQWGPYSALGKD